MVICFFQTQIFAQAPTALQYPLVNVFQTNVDNIFLAPTVSGNIASYSISPALPAGLNFNTSTGVISGTPTAAIAATNYLITATNASGSTPITISIQLVNSFYNNANGQVSFLAANAVPKVFSAGIANAGRSAGDIVLYTNVTTIAGQNIDCIVTSRIVNNVTSWDAYDQAAASGPNFNSNSDNFFSPQITFGAGGGSITFDFQFILGGSYVDATFKGTNVTLRQVKLNTYDIDGNGTAIQYNEFGGFSTSELGTTTNEVVSFNTISGLTRYTSASAANTPTITDPLNRVRVSYDEISDFSIVVGADNTGLAFFFLDFSFGGAFTTNSTPVPSLDLNTLTSGVNNSNVGCGTNLNFSGGTTQTNAASITDLTELSIEFATGDVLNGINERLVINGASAGSPIALNFINGAAITNVSFGTTITYSVTATVVGGASRLSFVRTSGSSLFTLAKAEELVDALRYQNNATTPTNGSRTFTINIRNTNFKSPDAKFIATVNCVSIKGNIYRDANGLTDNTVNPNSTLGQFADNSLFAILVDPVTNLVLQRQSIVGSAYDFGNVAPGKYLIYFSNSTPPTIGTSFIASTFPAGSFIATGENLGAGAGNDLLVDSKLTVTVGTVSVINANFGLQTPPTATAVNQASSINPGGFNYRVITPANFGAGDVDGTVSSITIMAFPTNTNVLRVGTVVYINGGTCPPQSSCVLWPGTLTIPYSAGAPTSSISVDPINGATTVNIRYTSRDNGNANSTEATLAVPFTVLGTPLTITGNVWNDANGDGNLNGAEALTNVAAAGQTLYAVLVQTSNTYSGAPTVYTSVAVNATTGYNFGDVPGGNDYTVRIISLPTAPEAGSAESLLAAALAPTYIGVSTNNSGTITTGLNTNNPTISIPAFSTSRANVNFGIERIPVVNNFTAASQANPGGTIRVAVPIAAFTGSDAEDGAYTAGLSGRKVTLNPATNGTLYYNNVAVSSSQTYTNFDPALVTMDPTGTGAVTTSFTYSVFDAADKPAIPATITMPFATGITLSGNVFNDKNGDANSTGDTFTNAGGLNAVLTDASGNVIESVAVNGSGFYTFTKATSSSIYNVVLSTTSPAIGTKLITSSLPTSVSGDWVNTGVNPGGSTPTPGNKTGTLAITTPGSGNVINQNFGIERLPLSNTQSYNIATPTGNSFLALNGTGAAGSPGPLTGSDVEDQPASGSLSGKNIRITSLPTNGNELWYNGAKISFGADGSTPPSPSNPLTITNYNPSLLQLRFTGIGSMTTTFNYNYVDAAGNPSSAAALYTVSWLSVLPVTITAISAEENDGVGLVRWSTQQETGLMVYTVERSENGIDFTKVGDVNPLNTGVAGNYRYNDNLKNVEASIIYYRLKIVNNDGSFTYSSIVKITRSKVPATSLLISPNPVMETMQIKLNASVSSLAVIKIISTTGQVIYTAQQQVFKGMNSIQIVNLSSKMSKGTYILAVSINNENLKAGFVF